MILLETDRLLLRHLEPEDLDDLVALYANPAITRFIPDAPRTREAARAELEWHRGGHPDHPGLGLWATVLKDPSRLVGRCGLLPWTLDGRAEVELAYLIEQRAWGQGLATEAARAIRDHAFDVLGLRRLVCLIDAENRASIRVAEKIGMAFEKTGRDEIGPFQLYAMDPTARRDDPVIS